MYKRERESLSDKSLNEGIFMAHLADAPPREE